MIFVAIRGLTLPREVMEGLSVRKMVRLRNL